MITFVGKVKVSVGVYLFYTFIQTSQSINTHRLNVLFTYPQLEVNTGKAEHKPAATSSPTVSVSQGGNILAA